MNLYHKCVPVHTKEPDGCEIVLQKNKYCISARASCTQNGRKGIGTLGTLGIPHRTQQFISLKLRNFVYSFNYSNRKSKWKSLKTLKKRLTGLVHISRQFGISNYFHLNLSSLHKSTVLIFLNEYYNQIFGKFHKS
uniref:Uncharacterized protein n=1 Tax=Glossina brevipalpis TaxID=37001 RepID=A0A1A9WA79_9MUSC